MNDGPAWDAPDPFSITLTVNPVHLDAYGHVNNVVYVAWLERCAWAHSEAVGFSEERCVELGRGMAVRTIHADYLAPCFGGDTIEVGNWIVANDGKLRASRRFQMINRTQRTVTMRAEIEYFCLNLATWRPTRMPREFRDAYPVTLRPIDQI